MPRPLSLPSSQARRRWIAGCVDRRKGLLKRVDQGSILLVVFSAFREVIAEGAFSRLVRKALVGRLLVNALPLAAAIGINAFASRR